MAPRSEESQVISWWQVRRWKWTAIGIAAFFGFLVLIFVAGHIEDEPEYPSNYAVDLTGRRVDVYRLDGSVFQAVDRVGGSGISGLEDSCGPSVFVAFESDGFAFPAVGSSVDASALVDRTEIARTTEPLCGDDYWVIIEGGGRVVPNRQFNRERLDGPFVRNLLDDDVDLFTFGWDDPGMLTGVGRVPSDFLRQIPELVSSDAECVDVGLVAFAASGEAIPNPNVEYQIGELVERSELGRTTEPLCFREYWLIEDDRARVVPESEYER